MTKLRVLYSTGMPPKVSLTPRLKKCTTVIGDTVVSRYNWSFPLNPSMTLFCEFLGVSGGSKFGPLDTGSRL